MSLRPVSKKRAAAIEAGEVRAAPGSTLGRGKGPSRRKGVRKWNPERRERLFARQFGSEARVKWFRMQECAVPLCGGWPSECAHVVSRGAGGTAEDVIPLCSHHHTEQHAVGVETFAATYHMDLASLAAEYDARYRRHAP